MVKKLKTSHKVQKLRPRKCRCCGKTFIPFSPDEWGCSPFCRSIASMKSIASEQASEKRELKKKIENTRYIPKLNLKKNPMARVDWIMNLPLEYRGKYVRFLDADEAAYMKELCKSQLAEERQYLGFFVKKDKIVLVKGNEEKEEPAPDVIDNDGTENED